MILTDSGFALIQWRQAALDAPYEVFEVPDPAILKDNAYIPGLSINSGSELAENWPEFSYDALEGRHPGKKINTGFADGHVSTEPADTLLVEETEPNSFCLGVWKP